MKEHADIERTIAALDERDRAESMAEADALRALFKTLDPLPPDMRARLVGLLTAKYGLPPRDVMPTIPEFGKGVPPGGLPMTVAYAAPFGGKWEVR